MPQFLHTPPLPPRLPTAQGFVQQIDLLENNQIVATLRWHSPPGENGAVQILELTVSPALQRKGLGSLVLAEAAVQAVAVGKARRLPTRRIWFSVEQKSQVIARAFLTRHGYHHVATIPNLLLKQDALVYVKSLD